MDETEVGTAVPMGNTETPLEETRTPTNVSELLNQSIHSCPNSQQRKLLRIQEYQARLKTFTPRNYFAKPIAVSPLICAVSGYQVAAETTSSLKEYVANLECTHCRAIVSILTPPNLSTKATNRLALNYQQQLWHTHKESCPFRVEVQFLLSKRKGHSLVVPTPFARVLHTTHSSVELLEHMDPTMDLFPSRVQTMYEALLSRGLDRVNNITLPEYVLQHGATVERNNNNNNDTSLLTRLRHCLRFDDPSVAEPKLLEASIAMVLCGWDLGRNQDTVECVFCQARHSLTYNETADNQQTQSVFTHTSSSSSKWKDPLAAHRYYCPWIAGFPLAENTDTTALWQVLADRLLADTPRTDLEIHLRLQASVSRKKLKRKR